MRYQLQFFSGQGCGDDNGYHCYDGSMSVNTFDPADLNAYAARMDCIMGPCVCVVTSVDLGYPRVYQFDRTDA